MRIRLLFLLSIFVSLECHAMEFLHKDTVLLTDINGIDAGRLGWAVAVNQEAVFMGAPEQDLQKGAAYEYRISQQRQLEFGRALDIHAANPSRYGRVIVSQGDVTAVGYAGNDGIEIYSLEAGNWVFVKLLNPPAIENVTFRNFSESIDLDGDFLVAGDSTANVGAEPNAGIVMIFGRNTGGSNNWGLITHFFDPDPPVDRKFGKSVSISSDLMVVGDDVAERALLYRRAGNSWTFAKELEAQDTEVDDSFGVSVDVEGDVIAVGSLNGNDADAPSNAGSVHIFHRHEGGDNNFGQVAQITPSAPEFVDRFGESLRLRQGLLVVGSPGAQQVYVFSRLSGNWTEEQQILPPEGLDFFNAEFGFDVDYDHGSIMVGSNRWPDIDGDRYGAVFLYEDPGIVLCGNLDGIFCDGFESD